MNKPYLVFMSGPNEYENIFELVNPIKSYIRGVCALIHDADQYDKGVEYLLKINNELNGGNIIFGPYTGDHSLTRNRILRETGIKDGDFLLIIDKLYTTFLSIFSILASKSFIRFSNISFLKFWICNSNKLIFLTNSYIVIYL